MESLTLNSKSNFIFSMTTLYQQLAWKLIQVLEVFLFDHPGPSPEHDGTLILDLEAPEVRAINVCCLSGTRSAVSCSAAPVDPNRGPGAGMLWPLGSQGPQEVQRSPSHPQVRTCSHSVNKVCVIFSLSLGRLLFKDSLSGKIIFTP